MSWQAYVDTHLIGTGKISQAAIVGLAPNGGVWATSSGFTISAEEQTAIRNTLVNPENALTTGLRIAGTKYFALQGDKEHFYGKQGANGVVIVKTNLAVLVCVYQAPIQAAEATPVVHSVADYLKTSQS
ncbi:profilin, required for normal timing of actin polymerization in response to thermal stress [Tulasnella sp. 330]|nr:profilin, required for normal timing of actin polymerization in response to thermal stress [Tulasnella sp. 330]KAG8883927.1 profilin, required for normal timing of actin polymerization in response to thermal stress [Tulasnella sp. 331]KAG8889246.1 profilin, required for normal timing of actin polymerization in response to thermal stress [Tulasnella sp. 332]